MNLEALGRAGRRALAGCLFTATTIAIAASANAGVRWRTGVEGPIAEMSKQELRASLEDMAAQRRGDAGPARVVVSFDRPLTDGEKDTLKSAGVSLLSYLSDNSYFASIDSARLNANNVVALAAMTNIRPIQRAWKLHPDLNEGKVQPWSIVGGEPKPGQPADSNPTVAAYIMFHNDVDFDAQGLAILGKHAAGVVSTIEIVNGAVIELPFENIKALADEDAVKWIEPPLPQFETMNFENRIITGANTAQAAPYNLSGAGITVLVFDGGTIRTTHQDFQGRAVNIDTDGVSDHATHVSGTIGGAGIADPTERGMAPGVQIRNAGFEWAGGNGFLYTDPGDLLAD